MLSSEQQENSLDWILNSLKTDALSLPVEAKLFTASDWAFVIEAVPNESRPLLWDALGDVDKSAILAAMREDARNQLLSGLSQSSIEQVTQDSTSEELVEILDVIPKGLARRIIRKLEPETKDNVVNAFTFTDKQLGRYINYDIYTVADTFTAKELLDELKIEELPAYTDTFLVISNSDEYLGQIDIKMLLSCNKSTVLANIAEDKNIFLLADMDLLEASNQVKNSGRSMLPILNDDGNLLGRFSLKDAVDVFQEHFESQVSHMGKMHDEDLFAPIITSSRRRAVWLGINLATAFIASFVIGLFDQVVAEVVALAILMPIVASMGGITGSQTLTLTIRGLATGQLTSANMMALGNKEVQVAFFNSLLWAGVVSGCVGLWFHSTMLAGIIALAIVVNMLVAAFSGIGIPVLLDKMGIDPALAGSVILTTVTDVVGFFVFLGTASLLLL